MHEPYKMVLISFISFFFLVFGIGFYYFVYPKKKINLFIVLILIACLPLISIFRPGSYDSGDLSINVYKSMSFFDSLKEGNVFPHWAGQLNATYGYPLFLFTYPLPYYLISFFHSVGFGFIFSVKFLLIITYLISGIGMYIFCKKDFGKIGGFIGGIFYMFAPYHLVDMHFRVDIGECLALAIMPFIMLFTRSYITKFSYKYFIALVISISCLILSHQAIAVTFLSIVGIYGLFLFIVENRKRSSLLLFFLSFVVSFLLSAFYILPVLSLLFVTYDFYHSFPTFPSIQEFFYSLWGAGFLFQGHKGELSYVIGYVQWVVIIFAIIFLFQRKIAGYKKKILLLCLNLFFIYFLLMQSFSQPLWYVLPFLKHFQFSYRLLAIEVFLTSYIAAIVLSSIQKKWIVVSICFLAVFTTILNWGNRIPRPDITDAVLQKNVPYASSQGEGFSPALPLWINPKKYWMDRIPSQHLFTYAGKATIKEISRSSTRHSYSVDVEQLASFQENTLYFPGWDVTANGKEVLTKNVQPNTFGTIQFALPPGNYHLEVVYMLIPIQQLSLIVSGIMGGGLILGGFYFVFHKPK